MLNKKWKIVLLLWALLLVPMLLAAQEQSKSGKGSHEDTTVKSPEDVGIHILETVVVIGKVPGPSLWRVTNGKNELYILGFISPLPSKMIWDSSEVEEILARTQVVLEPGGAEASISVGDALKIASLARSVNAAIKIPKKQKLEDLLSPLTFSSWQALKAKYRPNNTSVDRLRPFLSSQELYYKAINVSAMTQTNLVWKRVQEIAEEKEIEIRQTKIMYPLALDRKKYKSRLLAAMAESPADEATCFADTVNSLETDLEFMRKAANAWATGDISLLRRLKLVDQQPACLKVERVLLGFQRRPELDVQADDAWFSAAKEELSKNATTLAVMPLHKLMGQANMIERFRFDGYQVEAPDDESGFDVDDNQ